jgi:hypothetical protein
MGLSHPLPRASSLSAASMTAGRRARSSWSSKVQGDSCRAHAPVPPTPPPCWVQILFGLTVGSAASCPLRQAHAAARGADRIHHGAAWTWAPSSGRIPLDVLDPNGISNMIVYCCVDREVDCCFSFSNHRQRHTRACPRRFSARRRRRRSPERPRPRGPG